MGSVTRKHTIVGLLVIFTILATLSFYKGLDNQSVFQKSNLPSREIDDLTKLLTDTAKALNASKALIQAEGSQNPMQKGLGEREKNLIKRLEETVVKIKGGTSASQDQQPPVPSYRGTPPFKMRKIPKVRCMTDTDYNASPIISDIKGNENLMIPSEAILSQLTFEELSSLYHSYIERPQFLCPRKIRMGLVEDGGWFVCDMEQFKPKSPCLVYSVGINHDFSFDDDVIRYYGCEVHSFDPSMRVNDFRRNSLNYFHNLGMSGTNSTHGWRMMTLGSIKKLLNHSDTPISILKADIEMSEWTALQEMITTGTLKQVRQMSVEFHLHIAPPIHKDIPRDSYLFTLNVLRDLYTIGFRIFWTTPNYSCVFKSKCRQKRLSNCQEVNFVKVSL